MDNSIDKLDPVQENGNASHSRSIEQCLEEIDRALHQMLLLAELSASDSTVDRQSLQKALECLQSKIDRIADRLNPAES